MSEENQNLTELIVGAIDQSLDMSMSSHSETLKALLNALSDGQVLPNEVKWELWALDMRAVNREERKESPEARFRPMFQDTNQEVNPPIVTTYPDVDGLLDDEQAISYLGERTLKTTNPIRGARYADIVWTAKKRTRDGDAYKYGLGAVRAYIDLAILCVKQKDQTKSALLHLVASLDRAAELAAQLNEPDIASDIVNCIIDSLSQLTDTEQYRFVLDMGRTLQLLDKRFPTLVERQTWELIRQTADRGILHHEAQERRNLFILHDLMKLASDVASLFDKQASWNYRLQIAESLEKEAFKRSAEQGVSGGSLVGYKFMENAMRYYQELASLAPNDNERQRLQKKVQETKREVRRLIRSSESEMKRVSTSVKIPHDALEEFVKALLEVDEEDSLRQLSNSPDLLLNIETLRRQAKKNAVNYPLSSLFPKVMLRDGRKVDEIQAISEQPIPYHELDMWFQIHAWFLDFGFQRLKEEGRFSKDLFLSHLQRWEFYDEDDAPLIEVGLARYFADDFISALHVLTPRIEHMLKSAFEQIGLPSVAVPNMQQIREQTFGDFLRRQDVKSILGEDIWCYLNFSLVDEHGLNLRNDIAHGWIKAQVCNRALAQLVLFIILQLTRLLTNK